MRTMNHGTCSQDGVTIHGNYNRISGNGCTIIGNYNRISGNECTVTGNHNRISGNDADVTGNRNRCSGKQPKVVGNYNRSRHAYASVVGNHNRGPNGHEEEDDDDDDDGDQIILHNGSIIGGNIDFVDMSGGGMVLKGAIGVMMVGDGTVIETKGGVRTVVGPNGSVVQSVSGVDGNVSMSAAGGPSRIRIGNGNVIRNSVVGSGNVICGNVTFGRPASSAPNPVWPGRNGPVPSASAAAKPDLSHRILWSSSTGVTELGVRLAVAETEAKPDEKAKQEEIPDRYLCLVCMDREKSTVCEPCGQQCLCVTCAVTLGEKKDVKCPACNNPVTRILKTFS